ncbi:MAG: adenylosuccinate lyase [Gemmataceae bacterium]
MDSFQFSDNPLVSRYASRDMAELWGPRRKFSTWRRLWLALAEAEQELGLRADDGITPRIKPTQIEQLRAHLDDIDFARAEAHERRRRHDVMAHIDTYGEVCPDARDIIHLGATSCFVTDNTDLILMREGMRLLRDRLVGVLDDLARFAAKWRDLATLGYTHFQPAQLTTVGKRACLWCHDFVLDLHELEHRLATLRFRGVKGATGTQASFLALFHGDHERVRQLDLLVARKMGFDAVYRVTGQTYSRKVDSQILDALSGLGQSAHKFGTDLRLLAHEREIDEPFESEQVGSSAMAYKRNPMRAERMCGLARTLMNLPVNAAQTAATQWLERTLDDSVNRRLTLPQAFLTADAVLHLSLNISNGLIVNSDVIARNVAAILPYMATENILMEAVAHGGDRQLIHECIRRHSQDVTAAMKAGADTNDLLDRLKAEPLLAGVDFAPVLKHSQFVGRAPQQVDEFIAEEIEPIRQRYRSLLGQSAEIFV